MSHLILHILKVDNSLENQSHYRFSFLKLRKSVFKNVTESLIDSLAGKGNCCQTPRPELDPRDSHNGRRQPTPQSCPLTST